MRYNSVINNIKAKEWDLTIQQAYLFSWFYELPSWANKVMIENEIFYFASKNKAVDELPILTDKLDTMYRYYKQLEEKELIVIKKIDNKDYISLTSKGKEWNLYKSDYSENNPTLLGNLSEYNSENNPTYNNTIYNNNISNKDSKNQFSNNSLETNKKEKQAKEKLILFSESIWNDYETLRNKLKDDKDFVENYRGVDLKTYIEDCLAWSVSKNNKSTNNGWYLTLRKWMRDDLRKERLKKIKNFEENKSPKDGHINY